MEMMWSLNEFENYFFSTEVLLNFAGDVKSNDLFSMSEKDKRIKAMHKAIDDVIPGIARQEPDSEWWLEEKASKWLDTVFKYFYKYMGLPNPVNKSRYNELIAYLDPSKIRVEVIEKLDGIYDFLNP